MTRQLEFWTIATVVLFLSLRRLRHAFRGRRSSYGRTRVHNRRPRSRVLYSQRDLDRAYTAGVDTGAAIGPSDRTRRRWAREGFEVPR